MLSMASKNILRNKTRNALTILGVCAALSICAIALSLGGHVRSQLNDVLNQHQIDLVVQSKGSFMPAQSRISAYEFEQLQNLKDVRTASGAIFATVRTHFSNLFSIIGISEQAHFFTRVSILDGRWFDPEKNELILGKNIAGTSDLNIGSRVVLPENTMMHIVGTFSLGYPILDNTAIMDISWARKILQIHDSYNMILVQSESGITPEELAETINTRFPRLHAHLSADMADQLGMINHIEFLGATFAIIAVIVCCLVIINTFFMAVTERVHEIGILMAIGWSSLRISAAFALEGIILACTGWLTAFVLSNAFMYWAAAASTLGPSVVYGMIPPYVLLLTLALALILGLFGALIPVLLSLRMRPAQALRHEL